MKRRVFVSYSHAEPDVGLARRLVEALEQAGHDVEWDQRIELGMRWADHIARAIANSEIFVVLLSPRAVASDMVRDEIRRAHAREMRIVPIHLNFADELPYDLGAYLNPFQRVIWRDNQDFAEICRRIVAAVDSTPSQAVVRESPESRPADASSILPQADVRLRLDTGAMAVDSKFYVRRPADHSLDDLESVVDDRTIRIRGGRQSGKSSLLARFCARAHAAGDRVFYLDFQPIARKHFASLKGICEYIGARLGKELLNNVRAYENVYSDLLGPQDALRDVLVETLTKERSSLFVVLDEVDRIFGEEAYCDEFFALIRGWHNDHAQNEIWKRLAVVIAHSAEPQHWISDLNQSPFNIGARFDLQDFTRDQVETLAKCYGVRPESQRIGQVMEVVGGQPYLVRCALHWLAQGREWGGFIAGVTDYDGPLGDHLRRILLLFSDTGDGDEQRRTQPPSAQREWARQLRKEMLSVIRRGACENERCFFALRGAGLVVGDDPSHAKPRCGAYRDFLSRHLS